MLPPTMPSPFEVASALTPCQPGPNRFTADIPDGWQTGRGAFGGLVLSTLLRAIERCEPDAKRRVRTFVGDICGPVLVGPAELEVTVLRRGNNQTNLRADLRQNGEILAFGAAVLSTPRTSVLPNLRTKLDAVPSRETALLVPRDAPLVPTFTKHFDYEVIGAVPFSGAGEAYASGFIREREPPAALDGPLLVALLDCYWPASFTTLTMPRPIPTVSFTAEILCDPSTLDASAPLYYRGRTIGEFEGFQPELRELYDLQGNLVALNQQTFAVVK